MATEIRPAHCDEDSDETSIRRRQSGKGAVRRRFGRRTAAEIRTKRLSEEAVRQRCGSAEIRLAHCSGDSGETCIRRRQSGKGAVRRRFGRRTAAEIRPATPKRRFGVNAFRSRNAFSKPYRAGRITNAFRFFQPEEGGFGNSYYICAEAETPPRNERKPIKQ